MRRLGLYVILSFSTRCHYDSTHFYVHHFAKLLPVWGVFCFLWGALFSSLRSVFERDSQFCACLWKYVFVLKRLWLRNIDTMERQRQTTSIFLIVFFCVWKFSNGQIMYSVPEEAKPGTTVGNLAKDFSLNLDDLERRGFRIVSGQNERYFDLNRKTGTLHIKDRIDREELCGRSLKCVVELEAIVNSPLNMYRFEVNVLDINDNAPGICLRKKFSEYFRAGFARR